MIRPDHTTVRKDALSAYDAGLCTVRPKTDGSKAPDRLWKDYQEQRPSRQQVEQWFQDYPGLGAVCGAVSGNLEILEFDDRPTYEEYKRLAEAAGLGELVEHIEAGYLEQSPSGGIHWPYRCSEIGRNTKLARRPKLPEEMANPEDKVKVLIETRGEGGFIILASSHGAVHPSGKPYVLLKGGFETIATIKPENRQALWELARTFDQMPKPQADRPRPTISEPSGRSGDDLNARATWEDILGPHGWRVVYRSDDDVTYWRRPGKSDGISATTNYQGSDLLYVFSSSTVFETERGHSKFTAYAHLEHNGDFAAAAKALTGKGYGEPRSYIPSPPSSNGHGGPKGPVPPIDLTEDLPLAPRQFVLDCLYQQEYGDAQLFAYLYNGRLVYDHAAKQWFEWGGHHWRSDKTAKVRRIIAGQLAAQYLILNAVLVKELEAAEKDEAKEAANLKNHIKSLRERTSQLRQLRRIQRILDFAGSFLGIVGSEWDRKTGVLACSNGVINLRTGVLSPGDPEDYIRSACPTPWEGVDASAPRFQRFVLELFDEVDSDRPDISKFIQRAMGYGITGTVLEHILLIFYGPRGRNGKDTLLETIAYVLGKDIAEACSSDVFIAQERKASAGSAREDLYSLMGKRLVWASESDDQARLNANQIKLITGGGQIVCRACFGHQVSFPPTHLPILLTNFRPIVPDQDDALWERVRLIPFTLRFVDNPTAEDERKRDPDLREELKKEASGILAWTVRGAMEWYEAGRLEAPEGVKVATKSYQEDMNPLAEFLTDRCILEPSAEISNPNLWKAYNEWVNKNSIKRPLGRKTFSQRIENLEGVSNGYTADKNTRLWTGIDLAKVGTI